MTLVDRSSPDEKRTLLARLLQKRLQKMVPALTPDSDAGKLERFTIPVTDLVDEVALDPGIAFDAPVAVRDSATANVLLTGATGFLGAFLVGELLAGVASVDRLQFFDVLGAYYIGHREP